METIKLPMFITPTNFANSTGGVLKADTAQKGARKNLVKDDSGLYLTEDIINLYAKKLVAGGITSVEIDGQTIIITKDGAQSQSLTKEAPKTEAESPVEEQLADETTEQVEAVEEETQTKVIDETVEPTNEPAAVEQTYYHDEESAMSVEEFTDILSTSFPDITPALNAIKSSDVYNNRIAPLLIDLYTHEAEYNREALVDMLLDEMSLYSICYSLLKGIENDDCETAAHENRAILAQLINVDIDETTSEPVRIQEPIYGGNLVPDPEVTDVDIQVDIYTNEGEMLSGDAEEQGGIEAETTVDASTDTESEDVDKDRLSNSTVARLSSTRLVDMDSNDDYSLLGSSNLDISKIYEETKTEDEIRQEEIASEDKHSMNRVFSFFDK